MRGVVVAAVLLLSLASSGCFVADDDPGTQSTATSSTSGSRSSTSTGPRASGTATATGTSSGGPGNQAPVVNVTAMPANGTAPLNVTFSLTGTDADGDALQWVLMLPNATIANGSALPANVTHAFTEAGNHTVTLRVHDGTVNVTANVTIVVTVGGPSEPQPVEYQYVTVNPDGTCDAKGERTVGPIHIHDRPASPPQPGFTSGDGTWVYEESNGISGLQIGGSGESDAWKACVNPDTLVF